MRPVYMTGSEDLIGFYVYLAKYQGSSQLLSFCVVVGWPNISPDKLSLKVGGRVVSHHLNNEQRLCNPAFELFRKKMKNGEA